MFLRSLLVLLSAVVSVTHALSLVRFGLVASFPPRDYVYSAEIAASTTPHAVTTDMFMPCILFVFGTAAGVVVIFLIGRPASRDDEDPLPPRAFLPGSRNRPRRSSSPRFMEEAIHEPVHGKNGNRDWLIAPQPGVGGRRQTR